MKGQESSPGDTLPNKMPFYKVKPDQNDDLYNSLKRSNFNLGFDPNKNGQAASA